MQTARWWERAWEAVQPTGDLQAADGVCCGTPTQTMSATDETIYLHNFVASVPRQQQHTFPRRAPLLDCALPALDLVRAADRDASRPPPSRPPPPRSGGASSTAAAAPRHLPPLRAAPRRRRRGRPTGGQAPSLSVQPARHGSKRCPLTGWERACRRHFGRTGGACFGRGAAHGSGNTVGPAPAPCGGPASPKMWVPWPNRRVAVGSAPAAAAACPPLPRLWCVPTKGGVNYRGLARATGSAAREEKVRARKGAGTARGARLDDCHVSEAGVLHPATPPHVPVTYAEADAGLRGGLRRPTQTYRNTYARLRRPAQRPAQAYGKAYSGQCRPTRLPPQPPPSRHPSPHRHHRRYPTPGGAGARPRPRPRPEVTQSK